MSRRPTARSSKPIRSKGGTAIRVSKDGKVEAPCPQCGTVFRVPATELEKKIIECSECHKVFSARHTAGRKAHAPDYTKAYIGFGALALGLVVLFAVMASTGGDGGTSTKKVAGGGPAKASTAETYSVGTHPRAAMLARWAESVASNNRLVMGTHTDLTEVGKLLGTPPRDSDAVLKALSTHELTKSLRELDCASATLASAADMTAEAGKGTLFMVPKEGDARWRKGTRGEIEVQFRKDQGEQIVVTGWNVKTEPAKAAGEAAAKAAADTTPAADKPLQVEITDSGGTRKVAEVKPTAMGHWEKATPAQQKVADDRVAEILRSVNADNPRDAGGMNRAVLQARTIDDVNALVPRILNAMFELYGDTVANNDKLSQLNRALYGLTGWAVNYQVASSGDAAKDKAERESCVRQWFAWYHQNKANLWVNRAAEESLEPTGEQPPRK